MFMTQRLILALFLMNLGCAVKRQVAAAPPPPPYYQGTLGSDTSRLQESLFKGDQEVLSNEDIQRILTARITLDDRHRLAVLGLAPRYTWSQALADLEIQNSERFLQDLRSSPQLTEVRMMPTLLIPEKRTVPYLREAAARFQADLLLDESCILKFKGCVNPGFASAVPIPSGKWLPVRQRRSCSRQDR